MLIWNTRQVNDIPSNPLDCYWAVGAVRAYPRLYRIVEQYPSDTNGLRLSDTPELYILFEEVNGRRATDVFSSEKEFEKWKDAKKWDDCLFKGEGHFVHAYKTLEEAKARAEYQQYHIRLLMDTFFPNGKR